MKKKKQVQQAQADIGRGVIKDNFLAALVTSTLYKQQIVQAKKAKAHISVKISFLIKAKDKSLI